MKRWWMAAVLVLMSGLTACADDPSGAVAERVAVVELAAADDVLTVGDTMSLTATPRTRAGGVASAAIAWRSSDTTVAVVRGSGSAVRLEAVRAGTVRIEAEAAGKVGSVSVTISDPPPPQVAAVEILPSPVALVRGQQVTVEAIARAANGGVITGRAVSWSTTDGDVVAIIGEAGTATATVHAAGRGQAAIRVAIDGVVAEAPVQVQTDVASVEIAPNAFTLAPNSETTIQAIVKDAGGAVLTGRSVAWSHTQDRVATITPLPSSPFLNVQARAAGTTVITASVEGVTATATVQVEVLLPPPPPLLGLAFTRPHLSTWVGYTMHYSYYLVAQGPNGPVTNPVVTWSVDDTTIATVDASGVVQGRRSGTTRVRATSGNVQASALVTIFNYDNPGTYELTWDWWDGQVHLAPVVGVEWWTDEQGTRHEVQLFPAGGTLAIGGDGAYERVLTIEGWVHGPTGGRRVVQRQEVDQGTATIIVLGETGYRLYSTTTPGYEYMVVAGANVGQVRMRAAVGTAPVQEYMFRLKQ